MESEIERMILDSSDRSAVASILEFVGQYETRHPGVLSTIIISALVPRRWWESLLPNPTTLFLKAALRTKKS